MFAVVGGGSSCGAMESVNTSISIVAAIFLTADETGMDEVQLANKSESSQRTIFETDSSVMMRLQCLLWLVVAQVAELWNQSTLPYL